MTNLDNRIANADQILTTDIDKFCESTVDLYSNTCKPLLDVFIYIYRTTMTIGIKTPMYIIMYLLFSGVVLTHLRRPTGNLTIQEQKLEGEYRFVNSRVSILILKCLKNYLIHLRFSSSQTPRKLPSIKETRVKNSQFLPASTSSPLI